MSQYKYFLNDDNKKLLNYQINYVKSWNRKQRHVLIAIGIGYMWLYKDYRV